jgi:hypothetical protein
MICQLKRTFFKNYHSVVAYRPGVCESVSNGIAQNKKFQQIKH